MRAMGADLRIAASEVDYLLIFLLSCLCANEHCIPERGEHAGMDTRNDGKIDGAELAGLYHDGKIALGLDLGHGRKALQDITGAEWEDRWGENPRTERFVTNALMVITPLLYLSAAVASFIFWRWYLAFPGLALWAGLHILCSGFPHPRPGRWVLLSSVLWALSWYFGRHFLPLALGSTAALCAHLMYAWIGLSLRNYATRNPRALEEWTQAGFLRIGS